MKLAVKHDEFVKKCLTDIGMAKEFLEKYLQPKIKDKCDFSKLSIVAGSYIEDDLKAHASDIVYKLDLKDNAGCAYVYALIEHQSRPHKLMPFRILRYQIAIIQQHLDKQPKDKLPLVVPIVFYNGKATPYPYATEVADLFADKALFGDIGLGNFKLADLSITEDDEILQHNKLALLEMLLKHIYDRDFNAVIDYIVKAFAVAKSEQINSALIQGAIYYLLSGRKRNELNPLIAQLKQNLPEYGETFMTYAEELRREGVKLGKLEGKLEGKQEAQQEIVAKMLNSGIAPEKIAEITGIPVDKLQNPSQC